MANQVVELLFGVQGGASINGQSGRRIREDILGIVQDLKGTKYTQIEFNAAVSNDSLKRLREDVEKVLQDIKVSVVFDKKIDSISDSSGTGGSDSSGSGGQRRVKKDLAESARVNKLIRQYKTYYEWLTRAATTTPGDGEKQKAYFEASEKALQRATKMMQEYKLEGESLAKVEEARAEMQRRFDVQSDAFVGGLFDKDTIKAAKSELSETLGLYRAAHKLAVAAEKAPAGSNIKAELSAMAEEMRADADKARLIYDLHGKRGVEVDRLLTEQRRELTEVTRMQAAAEKDAAKAKKDKDSDQKLKERARGLEKVAEAYREVGKAQQKKNLAHSQKDSDNADREIAKALKSAESLRRSVGMTADEWSELRDILKAEGVQLQSAHQSLQRYSDAEAAAADRAQEASRKQAQQTQNAALAIRSILKQLQVFETLSNKSLIRASLPPEELAAFKAQANQIRAELEKLGVSASTADISLDRIDDPDQLQAYLNRLIVLNSGLNTAAQEATGLATANVKLETSYHKLANRAYDYMTRIQGSLSRDPGMMAEMQTLVDKLHRGSFESVAHGAQEFQRLQFRIKQAGLEAETLGQRVSRIFKEKFGFGVMATAAMYARSAISDVVRTVVDLDTKLTELKIVSGATGQEMVKYFDDAAAAAKRVAASIADIIDATTVYRRLGFEMSKSLDFAELTTMYSKVGNVDMSAAEDSVTSIIKAFDLNDVDEVRLAMDQLVLVGNNFAVSSGQLGEGLQNAGAALMAAGNTFTESLALLTASNNTLQDISKASTAMRTISARLRQSSAELEEIGDEGLAAEYNTTSKYRAKLLAITGVDILENDLKTFRSTYEILRDISDVWDSLEDIDQASVTEMLGGVRNQSQIASIMATFEDAEKIMEDTADAAGSMQVAYESYVDSIQGRLNTLTASSQQLFNNLIDSDLIKDGVSIVTALVNALNTLIETIGILPTVAAGAGLVKLISSVGAFSNEVKGALALIDGFSDLDDVVSKLQTFDLGVAKAALSVSNLSDAEQMSAIAALKQLQVRELVHEANIQDIVDAAKLDAVKSLQLKQTLTATAARHAEAGGIKAVTIAELNDALASAQVETAKRQEIVTRYANGAAAKSEAASIGGLGAAAKTAGAGLISAGKGVLGLIAAHPFIAAAAAIVASFMLVKKINENILKDLEEKAGESRDEYASLTSEVEDLESKLKDVQSRLKEIDNIGAPELVDQDELKKLEAQNEELERELRIKQALKKMADAEAEDDAAALLNKKYPDWLSNFTGKISQYNLDTQNQDAAKTEYARLLGLQQSGITNVGENNTPIGILIASMENDLEYYESSLEEQARVIKEFYGWMQTNIIAAIGEEATTDEAKQILSEWNGFLELYDDMLAKSDYGVVLPGSVSGGTTSNTETATAEKLNEKLASVIEKYKLLEKLQDGIKNGGKISADSLSGVVEQFSGLDQSVADYHQGLITADELVRRVATAYQAAVNDYSDIGGKLDIESLLADEEDVKTFSERLEDIVDKYNLLRDTQEAFSESGKLTSSTLSSIVEQFPAMEESVALYVAGMKSGKELIAELTSAYRNDEATWEATMKAKLYASEDFRKGLSKGQTELIEALADSYGVDLENFKTVEEAKSKIQAQIVGQLAARYRRYADATLEELKAEYAYLEAQLYGGDDLAGSMNLADERRLQAIWDAIESLEKAYSGLDDIVFEGWDWSPRDFSDSIDDAEDAFEKFKAKWEDWFSDMEFKVNLKYEAGDLDGANKLYQQMVDKAQELLNDAYAEGMTIDDEWVQDLITKVNTYKKALADLRIEEYDKLIEYNDKFDVWNHVDYTKLDKLKEKLAAINDQYIAGLRSYQEWYDAFSDTAGEIYDIQRDALEAVLDETLAAIKKGYEDEIEMIESVADKKIEALENEKDAYSELIALKKKLLEDARDEADYAGEVEKRTKSIAALQAKINLLALDNSREATAERLKLEEQLAQEQEALAKFQSDAATDAALEALDAQGEAFEKAQDDKIEEVEDTADAEIKILENQLDDEVALRRKAIAQIDRDYQTMMQNIVGYFEALGITIDSELLDKLREGLNLVSQFGSYDGADAGISSGAGSGITGAASISALVQQMKANSQAWWDAKTPGSKDNEYNAEQQRLANENERIASMLKAMGLDIWKENGQWFIRVNGSSAPLFSVYHSGGVAGEVRNPKADEIFALLRKGEVILNSDQQSSLLGIFDNAGKWMQNQMAASFEGMIHSMSKYVGSANAGGIGTYSPNIEVNIHHNGDMSDADARRYGNQVADVALDKLWSTLQRRGIT